MVNKKRLLLVVSLLALAAVVLSACGPAVATVASVSPVQMRDRLPEDYAEGLILLDVRTQQEWEDDCHIEGATLIPVEELPNRADELPKDAEIVVYCRSGNRSLQAATWLVENGFTDVSDMGGINDWKTLGYPVTCGP